MIKKPKPKSRKALDYNECTTYIEQKYKMNTRDVLGKHTSKDDFDRIQYQDFWHWVVNKSGNHITNGCYITFSQDVLDESEFYFSGEWEFAKVIFEIYMNEFATGGELEMRVSW